MTATEAARRRRKPWVILIPLALVVTLAVAWSGVWVYASNQAQREIAAWMEREARLGREWSCAERRLEGFPFRFELTCRAPSLTIVGADPIRITASSLVAVAQLWQPNHIVAEFKAPARVEDINARRAYGATWTLLQMSGVGDMSGRPQRLSLAGESVAITDEAASAQLLSAHRLEFHVRRSPAADGGRDGVDYAAGVTGATTPLLAAVGALGPLDARLEGTITAADDMRPMPVKDRLRAWAAAGGVLRLAELTLTTPKAAATAAGEVSLDPKGLLNGRMVLGFAGIEDLVKGLGQAGVISREYAPIVGAMAMAGTKGQVAGRRGVTFSLAFRDGTLQLGQFPVGLVPPLF